MKVSVTIDWRDTTSPLLEIRTTTFLRGIESTYRSISNRVKRSLNCPSHLTDTSPKTKKPPSVKFGQLSTLPASRVDPTHLDYQNLLIDARKTQLCPKARTRHFHVWQACPPSSATDYRPQSNKDSGESSWSSQS